MMRARPFLLGLVPLGGALLLFECANLPPLGANSCGNGVVEPANHEDCDGFPRGAGTQCGAPSGGPQACRLVCSSSGTPACPPGWGCGLDGICRQPSGDFQSIGAPIAAGAWRVNLGDFDGDGLMDALTREKIDARGASRVRVQYFASDGSLAETLAPSSRFGSPVIVDLNADGSQDLAFAYADGISVLLGQPDRTMAPAAYPLFSIPDFSLRFFFVNGFIDGTRQCFLGTGPLGTGLYSVGPTGQGMPKILTQVPDGPDSFVGDVLVATVIKPSSTYPCPEFVYETNDPAHPINVLSPCSTASTGLQDWNRGSPPISVALPSGASVCQSVNGTNVCSHGVSVADFNGDGNMDLLAGGVVQDTTLPGSPWVTRTFVAYGDGLGNFNDGARPPNLGVASGPFEIRLTDLTKEPLNESLAAGDLNGDGYADLVTPNEVLVRIPNPLVPTTDPVFFQLAVQPNGSVPWTSAAVADFNGNGQLDVAAGRDTALDIDFFNGSKVAANIIPGGYVLYPFSIPTTGAVSHFAPGDFDGDLLTDLAFAQADTTGDGSDQVAISYGLPSGAPDLPLVAGRFQRVLQISPATPATLLSVASVSVAPPAAGSITLLTSSGDRPPLSSYALAYLGATGPNGIERASVVGLGAGVFTPGDTPMDFPDLAAVGLEIGGTQAGSPKLWLVPDDGPASFGGAVPGAIPSNFQPFVGDRFGFKVLVAVGDVDASGSPDLVAIAPPTEAVGGTTGLGSTLAVGSIQGPSFGATTTSLAVEISEEGQLELSDVDGDGALDMILLTGSSSTARSLLVYWNDGQGNFDDGHKTQVDPGCDMSSLDACPEGFARIDVDATALASIAFVTHLGATRAQPDKSRGFTLTSLGLTDTTDDGPSSGGSSGFYYTGIAAGDITGDGVADVAVIDNGSLELFAGKAVNP